MDLQALLELVMGQGVFAALFIWLFFTYQKESREREERLMSIVDSQAEKLEKISTTLEKISQDIQSVTKAQDS
ncbi:MAG: holin [Ruminococcaceae bacterium]|nr:holin [Oscillospiraceae bacterium]